MLKLSAFSLRPAFRRAGAILLALAGVLPSAHPCFAQAGRSPLIIDYSPLLPAPGLTFDIIQDDEGTLYLAGTSFLTFDGDHWTSAVTLPDSFAIRRLRLGPDGRAWAAAMSDLGWFERGTDRQWRFHSLRAHLPEPGRLTEVWNVAPDATGATFVTENQVLRWDGTGFKTWEMPGTRRLFSCAADGVFLVNYQRDGLYTVDASGPQLLIPRALLGDAAVFWAEHHGAEWLLGTGDGFFRYDGRSLLPFGTEIAGILREHKITAAARLPDGRIAVGTMTAGIVFLTADGAVEYRLDTSNGLPTNSIDGVFSRTDGELWAATRTHILRIDDRPASALLDANVGLPRQAQRKFARLGGQLVVGNDNGVYLRDEATGKFSLVDALKGRPYHLQPTDDGLLVSGYRGVRRYVNGTVTPFYDTLVNVFFCQPSRTVRGDFLIGDNRRIVRRRSDGTVRELVPRLPDNPSSLAEDAAGNLWIGLLAHGVVAVRADGGPLAPESSGLPPLSGRTQVRGDAFGSVVVFSDAGAWIRTGNGTRFMPVENYPRRPGAFISEFNPDGTCWVVFPHTATHAPSLGRVIVNTASAEWQPHSVDGLLQVGTPQGIFAERSAPGEVTLWIGGSERVLKHSLRQVSDPKPRPPVLRGFSRTAREEQRAPIVGAVPYAAQSIQFEVAAPEYRRRELLRLQTRLDGIDHEWVTLGRPSTRDLSALRAGDYRVRARVVAETGTTSDEVTLPLRVLPPWWRTAPAYGGVIVAVGLALVGAYRLRVGTLRRRNRELEDNVRLRTRELEAANLAKTQFVANMSHDIRNPLNGIVGLTFALEDSPLDRRQRDIVATLRDCSTYLSTLVDDVLDFASIEAGRVELRPGPFSPAELVRSLGATMKPDATASGATLSFAVAADVPPQLFGDAGRIQQILVNFVSNAVKYAGGQIEVAILRPPHAPEEIEFAVTDSGPGLSAEEQATLFTKFARLDRSRRENIPGVGLGLASCRLLADLMGGGVGVESGPGRGSRFFLRLPLAVPVPAPEPAASNLPDARVLLVEDADYNAWAATAVLSRLGLSCDRARTGEEALQLFRAKRYNIVLLDRNLPDLHGTEVARRIRKLESESEGLPSLLLAVTAYCTARDRELCLEAGMDAFVGKPVTPDKLKRVLLAAGRKLLSAATIEAPREAAPAELDLSLLTYLSDGTEDGLAQQARRFLETLASTTADLDRAGRENDCAALAGRAHDVLGQAKMIGHTRLVAAASQLEYVARAGDPAACGGRLRVVIAEIESLNALIRRRPELAGLPSSHARAHNAQDQSAFAGRVSGGR